MTTYTTLLLVGGGVFLTLGDILFKYYAGHHNPFLYGIGLILYLGGLIPLIESFKYADVQVASAVLVIFNIAALTVVGWLFFKEDISAMELVGLGFAGVAIILLEIGG